MALTDINSEDRLVQQTFADHLEKVLGWESVYAYNAETFGPHGMLGRASEREVVLVRDLRAALERLNPDLPESAREQAIEKITRIDFARSLVQHNRECYGFIRGGVPVEWRDAAGEIRHAHAHVIDFRNSTHNRFLAVRELKVQGVRVPHYNRRADLVCFVNGLPLVFIELKAVYRNIRAGFDDNLTDYLTEHSIAHAFHHNVFTVVSNDDQARYGSITSKWERFVEWKRDTEKSKARLDAEALLDGMLAKERLLDLVENFILFDDGRAGGSRKIVARNHQVLGVTFAQLVALAAGLDAEQRRAAQEGLSDDELALFDLLFRDSISTKDRERLKQASRTLLSSLQDLIRPRPGWLQNATTQAQVKIFILDSLYQSLPRPPFTDDQTEAAAALVYDYIWQRSAGGHDIAPA